MIDLSYVATDFVGYGLTLLWFVLVPLIHYFSIPPFRKYLLSKSQNIEELGFDLNSFVKSVGLLVHGFIGLVMLFTLLELFHYELLIFLSERFFDLEYENSYWIFLFVNVILQIFAAKEGLKAIRKKSKMI